MGARGRSRAEKGRLRAAAQGGNSPLFCALYLATKERQPGVLGPAAEALLAAGANPTKELHSCEDMGLVEALLRAGADPATAEEVVRRAGWPGGLLRCVAFDPCRFWLWVACCVADRVAGGMDWWIGDLSR